MDISLGRIEERAASLDVQLAKRGDKAAFERLIEEHKYTLYRIARGRLRGEEDIEDAFQETIIKAYKGIGRLKSEEYFKTWLIRIMINECTNLLRKTKDTIYIEDVKSSVCNIQEKESRQQVEVFELINELEENLRMVTLLYFYEDMPQREIAKVLEIPHGTVRSRVSRAKEKLRELMSMK